MRVDTASVQALSTWLLEAPHVNDGGLSLASDLAQRVRECGIPIVRFGTNLLTKHPELCWRTVRWGLGEPATATERRYDQLEAALYLDSPVRTLREGAPTVRVRLVEGPLPYPVCVDLRAEGGTDFYAQSLPFTTGETSYASWTTREPGGFSDEEVAALDTLAPSLARRIELESAYHATRALLEVYLGQNAARRVASGAFRRGGGELIEAAIWFCDMRGFTSLSDRMLADQVVEVLDAYFDCVAEAVGERGGEVLKFVGDAILAIFPIEDGAPGDACVRALAAAEVALVSLRRLSDSRQASGQAGLEIGIALHLGNVMYGNVGSRQRLDFTVISAAVNEACRLEGLCKDLGTPLTLSEAFVRAAAVRDVVDLGTHALKGVIQPIRVFTLPGLASANR